MSALLAAAIPVAEAAGGSDDLDAAFGSHGIVITRDPERLGVEALAVTRDGRGRAVVAGVRSGENSVLFRYRHDGSLDPTFGSDGRAIRPVNKDGAANAVTIQPDGKIVFAGASGDQFVLGRYLPDGSLDRRFGHGGIVVTFFRAGIVDSELRAVGLEKSGRIVAAGYGVDSLIHVAGFLVAYRPDGEFDRSFGKRGFVRFAGRGEERAALSGLVVLPSGKILVAGKIGGRILLARCLPNGALDRHFGGDGEVLIPAAAQVTDLTLAPGGRPLIAASAWRPQVGAMLMRFMPNGKPDRSFGHDGTVLFARPGLEVHALTMLRGGGMALAGSVGYKAAVVRLRPDGRADPSFADDGLFTRQLGLETEANAVAAEPDGGFLVVGRVNRRPGLLENESVLDTAEFMLMRFRR